VPSSYEGDILVPRVPVVQIVSNAVTGFRYRRIDTAGSELAIVSYAVPNVREGDTVHLPGGRSVIVLQVYDDEHDSGLLFALDTAAHSQESCG
jgi:hypothetical protein